VPGSGWPEDPATLATPVAVSAADVQALAASAPDLDELVARQSVCRACPRLVSWRKGDQYGVELDDLHYTPPNEIARLNAMTEAHRFIWVQGNHDPTPPNGLGGTWVETHSLGPVLFRHQARDAAEPGEIAGHHHPKATIPARAGSVSRPCFVFDGYRLMMPAFGAYTGGLDVRDPAIHRLFPKGGRIFLLGKDRLFSFEIGRGSAVRLATS